MHTKIIIVVLLFFSLTMFIGGCVKQPITGLVEDKRIFLSLEEMQIYPKHLCDTSFVLKYKYVVYVDSVECSACKIAHMGIWNYFKNELEYNNAGFYMILYSTKDKVEEIKKVHDSYKHRIPIYIDTLGVFKRDNPQIAGMTTEFHSFLLDENNKIVVFGDASTNHYVRDEIFRILEEDADSTVTENHP